MEKEHSGCKITEKIIRAPLRVLVSDEYNKARFIFVGRIFMALMGKLLI